MADSPEAREAREAAATVLPGVIPGLGAAAGAHLLGRGWYDECRARQGYSHLAGPELLTCTRTERYFFGTDRDAAASMADMDRVIASIGLGRTFPNDDSELSGPVGGLEFATVDPAPPMDLHAGWTPIAGMPQPPDFNGSTPTNPPTAFFQAEKAGVASWWPAASRRYRYLLEIWASWTYFTDPPADDQSSSPEVRPS